MRLHVSPFAPNALRVSILAAEKGPALETFDMSAMPLEAYRAINPFGQVPALVLDDGRVLTESLIIARHLDDASGSPRLFGEDADERQRVALWERRAEMHLFNPAVEYGHHTHPMFGAFMRQFPDYAATLRPRARTAAGVFEAQLAGGPYVAGDRFTAADITALLGFIMLSGYGAIRAEAWPRLRAWRERLLARPSMAEARMMHAWLAAPRAPAAGGAPAA